MVMDPDDIDSDDAYSDDDDAHDSECEREYDALNSWDDYFDDAREAG
jgi:hypothetical protein